MNVAKERNSLRGALADSAIQGRYVQLFGSGTAAIYATLLALGCKSSYVGLQSTVCPSVVVAVLSSGN